MTFEQTWPAGVDGVQHLLALQFPSQDLYGGSGLFTSGDISSFFSSGQAHPQGLWSSSQQLPPLFSSGSLPLPTIREEDFPKSYTQDFLKSHSQPPPSENPSEAPLFGPPSGGLLRHVQGGFQGLQQPLQQGDSSVSVIPSGISVAPMEVSGTPSEVAAFPTGAGAVPAGAGAITPAPLEGHGPDAGVVLGVDEEALERLQSCPGMWATADGMQIGIRATIWRDHLSGHCMLNVVLVTLQRACSFPATPYTSSNPQVVTTGKQPCLCPLFKHRFGAQPWAALKWKS